MKNLLKSMAVLVMCVTTAGVVYGSNTDSLEISVTPVVIYSVQISTPALGIVFNSQDLNTAYVNASSVTITNNGNVTADWKLKAAVVTGAWALGTTLTDNASNKMVLAARFNNVSISTDAYTIDGDVLKIGETNADASHFAGNQNGDNVAAGESKGLWIYVKTPSVTTVETEQKFRIDVQAYSASTF